MTGITVFCRHSTEHILSSTVYTLLDILLLKVLEEMKSEILTGSRHYQNNYIFLCQDYIYIYVMNFKLPIKWHNKDKHTQIGRIFLFFFIRFVTNHQKTWLHTCSQSYSKCNNFLFIVPPWCDSELLCIIHHSQDWP